MSKCLSGDVGINLIAKGFKLLRIQPLLGLMLEQQKKEKIYLKKHKKFDLKRIEMKGAIVDLLLLLFLKLEKEAEQIEEGKSLDILGEII